MSNIGIYCNVNTGRTVQIKGNTINKYKIGIDCYNNLNSNVTISSNLLNASTTSVTIGVTGILMEEATPQASNVTINLNTIKYNNYGIWLRNVQKAGSYYVNTNEIRVLNSTPSASNIMYGIRMENANGLMVMDNTIYKSLLVGDSYGTSTPLPTAATYQYFFGITAELSANCFIKENHIYKIGRSIYFLNNCTGSYFLCNDLHRCFTGLYFSNATIPSQYTYSSTVGSDQGTLFDNMVILSTAYRFEGIVAGSGTVVYRQPSALYTNTPFSTIGLVYSNPLVGAVCSAALPPPDSSEVRSAFAGQTVNATYEYPTDSTQFVYWDKQQAYKFLTVNPEFITLGEPDDANYQDFVSNEANTEIGQSNTVYGLIGSDLKDSAQAVNDTRTGETEMEQNSIVVSNLYLKLLAQDSLSSEDSTTLNTIALSDPFTGGEAVYIARVILHIDPTVINENRSMTITQPLEPTEQGAVNFKVYPNPGADAITIELAEIPGNDWQLVVMDETGKQVVSRTLQQISRLDVKSWPEGLYLVIIRKEGAKLNEQKLIIQH
jgi:hypothetical protein